jgi:hypothetical protein
MKSGRKFLRQTSFLFLFIYLIIESAFAGSRLDLVYQQLKDTNEDYKKVGTICEQVAKLSLEQLYQMPEYEVKTGIIYSDRTSILGELDAVVFHRASKSAILAAEVKCWRDQNKALKKAKRQLGRFLNWINSTGSIDFFLSTDSKIHFRKEQFQNEIFLLPVSYKGSGFAYTLEFSLSELLELRERILEYQKTHPFKDQLDQMNLN